MAKEFKRSGSKDFKGKKPYRPAKDKDQERRTEGGERRIEKSSPFSSDRSAKKPWQERSGDNTRDEGNSKRTSDREFKGDKSFETKKPRPDKRDNKPTFERFRDESRPSDFGSSRNRRTSNFNGSDKKSFSDKPTFKKRIEEDYEKPSFRDSGDDKPRSFSKKPFAGKPDFKKKRDDRNEKPFFRERGDDKSRPFGKKTFAEKPAFARKSAGVNPNDLDESDFEYGKEKPKFSSNSGRGFKKSTPYVRGEKKYSAGKKNVSNPQRETDDGLIRLNKYLANAGICSRREADDLISSGVVQVNGKTITEMGYRVKPTDIIKYGGQTLKKERLVYFVLNKPKDYISTVDDPQQRKTVLELVQGACRERIYPVGRLDRATTGLLMFTNDGELTKKLTHPRFGVRKIYHVELDKPLKHSDMDKIAEGIELEDGPIKVDEISYAAGGIDKTMVGVEIHSGKNRIVRRIFEHMGYNVRKLDRVMFGSLTKKDLPRGRWRVLTDAEVGMLKMISAG